MAFSLRDLEPGVLQGMSSGSPLTERPHLESKPSRMQSVIDTMQSYVHPSTPKLDDVAQGAIKSIIKEKETELANITAERSRLVHQELEQMQERERKHLEDNNKLKGQLKQLTKDFQYNLQLLKDRDTELELLENQISAHKETSAMRAKELSDAIQRIDELKVVSISNEQRAGRVAAEAQAAEDLHRRSLEQLKLDHKAHMSDVVAQLQDAKQQLQHQLSQFVNERHSTVSEHSRRAQQLEQELAQVRAQLADSESLNEQLRLHGQSSDSKQEQLLQKLQSSEAAVSSLEIEHRAFVDKVNAACQSKDDEIRGLREHLDIERRVARSRQSGEQKEYGDTVNRLQEQLEEQAKELKRSVRERQDLEVEHAALQKQANTDREVQEELLFKSQTDQAVASCELEACKKQVVDLQQTLTAMQRERDSELGRTGDFSAQLAHELREKESEIQQLSQEVVCCREEATCMQRAHESACQQIQHLTGELDHIAALSVKEKHTAEDAESQAKDARQRAEVAVGEKNALKATLERQIAILEDKCENQNSTQQQEQERLQNYWQKRLAKMEQEYSKKHAKQTAESHTIREECSVAMSRVKDAQQYMRNWHSTVSSVQEHCARQQHLTITPYAPTAPQPTVTPSHLLAPSGVENRLNSAPAAPLYHVNYSTTVNVPQSPAHGSSEPHNQSIHPPGTNAAATGANPSAACPIHTVHAAHGVLSESHQRRYPGGQQPATPFLSMASSGASGPGHLQCTCGNVNCTERPRMPFADATNAPFAAGAVSGGVPVQQAAVPHTYGMHQGQAQPCAVHSMQGLQPQPCAVHSIHGLHAHAYPFGHPGTYRSGWNSRSDSMGHDSEDSGDRYKSSALARMQRMQERLKASEKNLNTKLGRLLGMEGEKEESKHRR